MLKGQQVGIDGLRDNPELTELSTYLDTTGEVR
jgi:hypothetical protein